MARIALKDIAAKVGYSKNTVSLALRGDRQIPESTRKLIVRVADEMGYERNIVTSQLMARLRSTRSQQPATLALVNGHNLGDVFVNHPTIPAYVQGAQQRARHLGYETRDYWLNDPEKRVNAMVDDMASSGVQGVILIGMFEQNRLRSRYRRLWEEFPCIVTGVRTHGPCLSFACVDHHHLTLSTVVKALELGYRRPALVISSKVDDLVDHRFAAGFHSVINGLPAEQQVPPFFAVEGASSDPQLFLRWFKRHQPDVLITLHQEVFKWIKLLQLRCPRDVGVIQLEWRASDPHIAGMNQHNDLTGSNAVDMVVSLIHGQEKGAPAFPRAMLTSGTWTDGDTVRDMTKAAPRRTAAAQSAAPGPAAAKSKAPRTKSAARAPR